MMINLKTKLSWELNLVKEMKSENLIFRKRQKLTIFPP